MYVVLMCMHWVCMDLGTQMLCFLTSVAVVWSGPV